MAQHHNALRTAQFALSISLLGLLQPLHADWFDMDDLFSGMEHHMLQMRQEMEKMQESMRSNLAQHCSTNNKKGLRAQLTENSTGNGIVVTLSNLETDSVDAQIDDQNGMLRITTPQATVKIATRNTIIAIDVDEKLQQESSNQNGDASKAYFCSQSKSYVKQQLSKSIDLEKAKIDYNPEIKQLSISIAYADDAKNGSKKVPVTFLKSSQKQEAATTK